MISFYVDYIDGLWIVSMEWIAACLKAKALQPEATFEVADNVKAVVRGVPRLARTEISKQVRLSLSFLGNISFVSYNMIYLFCVLCYICIRGALDR